VPSAALLLPWGTQDLAAVSDFGRLGSDPRHKAATAVIWGTPIRSRRHSNLMQRSNGVRMGGLGGAHADSFAGKENGDGSGRDKHLAGAAAGKLPN